MRRTKTVFVPRSGKSDLAMRRLEEHLGVSFRGKTVAQMSRELNESMKRALMDRRLKETLLSDSSQAVAKVLDIVWEAAKPNLIGRELVQVMAKDAPSLKIPRAKLSKAYEVAEGAEIPIGTEDYDSVTLTPKKYGVRPLISREMIEDAEWDVIQYQLAEAGRSMADIEAEKIITQMISDAGNSAAAATSGTLAYADVADMIKLIMTDNYNADIMAVHPTEFADLLKDTAIQKAMDWGGPAVAPTGRIATLLGLRVLVSTKVTSGTVLLVDSKHAGVLFIRRDITTEEYEDPVKDLAGVAITARWVYKTLRTDAIGKVTGA
jgi:HK97 family phage major capsid protein